jgi:anti-sigma regulatory factor (Ser/Thr protein kinase)
VIGVLEPAPTPASQRRTPDVTTRHVRRIPVATAHSPANARHWAQPILAEAPALLDTALIALSELVTNVALHAPGSARVTITRTAVGVEIAVADHWPGGIPQPIGDPDWTSEHQRGLVLLNAFGASGVTVRHVAGWGKEVVIVLATEITEGN